MKSLSYLNKYFYKYRWRFILGILFITIQNYFGAKIPIYVGESFDTILGNINSTSNPNSLFHQAITLALLVILFNLIAGFFLFLTRQSIIIMSRLIEFDLKNEIFIKYQELDYNFYKSKTTGDLMNRISEDVAQVRQYLGPGIMYTINLIILFPFLSYQLFAINTKLALTALAPLPIMAILIYFVSSKMNKLGKNVQGEQSNISTIAQETFSGIRVIKAYIQERHARLRFNKQSQLYLDKTMNLVRTNALFMPTISLLIGISTLLSIYLGGLLAINEKISIGQILAVVLIIQRLTWPFASVGWVTSIIQRAGASQERINEFLKTKSAINPNATKPETPLNNIKFKHVSFQYKPDLPLVLKDINFQLKQGETLGIIGKTGSGKTTLIQLLVRQLDPTNGSIKLNNQSLDTINLHAFRKQLSIVPQDVFLFSDTIASNIAFGSITNPTSEEIEQAAKDAHVYHNIQGFKDGFNTILGERGVNLSGGQKQRVSIARALIRKPKLLILDDCLSAVDTETEDIILSNLKSYTLSHNTTTVIVSHRLSSLRNADQIIVLEDGAIIQAGKPEQLLHEEGAYKTMYNQQLAENKEF